tara:strand:+ start:205 stop:597 length:393 start_codon:yes stop_codon:yes gene_type:complete
MNVQINRDDLLPKILSQYGQRSKGKYETGIKELSNEVIDVAQEWCDLSGNTTEQIIKDKRSTRDLRIELKTYVKLRVNLRDKDRSYFVPTFVWMWLAEMVISYIAKIIIEKYFNRRMHLHFIEEDYKKYE